MELIYKITNTTNGKVIIGQTKQGIKVRFAQHLSKLRTRKHGNTALQSDFNIFGEDAFSIVLLEQFNLEMNFSLDNLECYWIKHFDSTNPAKGYNKTTGGIAGFQVNEESKKLNSDSQTRQTSKFVSTSQWKKDNPKPLKQPNKSRKGENNPMFGKASANRRKVRCTETGQIFESLHEAGREMKILVQNLVHHLKGRYKQTGGHTFEYVD